MVFLWVNPSTWIGLTSSSETLHWNKAQLWGIRSADLNGREVALATSGAPSGVGNPLSSFPPKLLPVVCLVLHVKQELFKALCRSCRKQVVKFDVYIPPFENPPRHLRSCCSAISWGLNAALTPFTAISGLHPGYLVLCFNSESLAAPF